MARSTDLTVHVETTTKSGVVKRRKISKVAPGITRSVDNILFIQKCYLCCGSSGNGCGSSCKPIFANLQIQREKRCETIVRHGEHVGSVVGETILAGFHV
jgi:hypothetical protein